MDSDVIRLRLNELDARMGRIERELGLAPVLGQTLAPRPIATAAAPVGEIGGREGTWERDNARGVHAGVADILGAMLGGVMARAMRVRQAHVALDDHAQQSAEESLLEAKIEEYIVQVMNMRPEGSTPLPMGDPPVGAFRTPNPPGSSEPPPLPPSGRKVHFGAAPIASLDEARGVPGPKRSLLKSLYASGTSPSESPVEPGKPGPAPKRESGQLSLENLIGGRWYAWVGAIIFVIGMGWAVKYGYDLGLFHAPPWLKCIGAAALGFGLLGVGSVVRRRVNDAASASVYGAGLGTIYASVYGAYRLYDLLPPTLAFALLAATALLGIAVAASARLPVVAVLSLLGGYTTPILFASASPRPLVLPAYLVMLLVIGLTLTAKMGRSFALVRSVTRLATLIIGGYWALSVGASQATAVLAFLGLVWLAFHAELWYSAGTKQVFGGAGEGEGEGGEVGLSGETLSRVFTARLESVNWSSWSPFMATFSVTAWAAVSGVVVCRNSALLPDWCITAGLTAATAVMGMVLAGHLDWFRQQARTDAERLGVCSHLQSGALLLVTVALMLGGWAQVTAWFAMALAAMLGGLWLRSRAFHIYGLIVLIICTGRLLVFDSGGPLTAGGETVIGLHLTAWTLLTAMAGASWLGAAWIISRRGISQDCDANGASSKWRTVCDVSIAAGWLLAGGSLLHRDIHAPTATLIALGTGLAMMITAARLQRVLLWSASVIVLGLAAPACLASYWWTVVNPDACIAALGLYFTSAASIPILLACGFFGAMSMLRRWEWSRARNIGVAFMGVGIAFLFGAVLHERALSQSVVWVWIGFTGVLAACSRFQALARLDRACFVGLLASMACWTFAFTMHAWQWEGIISAAALAAGCFAMSRWYPGREGLLRDEVRGVAVVMLPLATALVFVSTSYEVAYIAAKVAEDLRVRAGAVSIWWGLFAFGAISLGFARRTAALRRFGLVLLAVASVKGLIVDLWDSPTAWKVASFIVLGLLMIAVGVVYQKLTGAIAAARPSRQEEQLEDFADETR